MKTNLKDIRLQAGLTQAQLAELFGLSSQNYVSKLEAGEYNPSNQLLILYKLLQEGKLTNKKRSCKMERNEKFETIINQIQIDNKEQLQDMTLLEYVELNIKANTYWFFTADTDEEVEQLNQDFINYVDYVE
jgi:transcriptional regulator with XRE-family HTH domain